MTYDIDMWIVGDTFLRQYVSYADEKEVGLASSIDFYKIQPINKQRSFGWQLIVSISPHKNLINVNE